MGESGRQPPEIELVDTEEPTDESAVVVTSRSRKGRVVAVVALVGLLAVATIVSRQDDRGTDASGPSTKAPTSLDPTSSTADGGAEEASAGFYLNRVAAPVLDGVVRGSLLIGGGPGGWRQVDLATGWVASLPDTAVVGVDPREMVPLRGGVAFIGQRGPVPLFLRMHDIGPGVDLSDVRAAEFEVDLPDDWEGNREIVGIHSAGTDDRLWVITSINPFGAPVERRATLVGIDGQRLAGPFPIPASPVAGSEHGVLFNAGGRGFLAEAEGTTDLGEGEIHDASASHVGRVSCSPSARCHQQTVDLTDPEIVLQGPSMPTDAVADRAVTMAVRDDGSLAAIPVRIGRRSRGLAQYAESTAMDITSPDGRSTTVVVEDVRSAPVWLPDGNGLVILTGRSLIHYTETDGEMNAVAVGAIRTEGATGVVFVPPQNADGEGSPSLN